MLSCLCFKAGVGSDLAEGNRGVVRNGGACLYVRLPTLLLDTSYQPLSWRNSSVRERMKLKNHCGLPNKLCYLAFWGQTGSRWLSRYAPKLRSSQQRDWWDHTIGSAIAAAIPNPAASHCVSIGDAARESDRARARMKVVQLQSRHKRPSRARKILISAIPTARSGQWWN